MATHLLGIRHHGPGSARHLVEKLSSLKPDILLIEGPPEGEAMLEWANHADMKPPVALLAYVPENPKQATFYPFTFFSPEWQAILYGLENRIPIRFIDMPLANKLAKIENDINKEIVEVEEAENIADEEVNRHPMWHLAQAAGFDDPEEWWEQQFELRQQSADVFEAIEEAFCALRANLGKKESVETLQREAFMRQGIRQAEKEMYHTIAVVCGAWHVPALKEKISQKSDNDLTKKLAKTKVSTTWIPWTNDRLSFESGYGAGVNSPGYYSHQWHFPHDDGIIWLSKQRQFSGNIKWISLHRT